MLDVSNYSILKKYLVEHGIAEAASSVLIEPLTGGVSNSVLKILCDKGRFVLKQALPKLKVSSEWTSDVERANVEKQALKFLPGLIPGFTPGLVYEDEANYLFLMECAPETAVTWKSQLMHQQCNERVAWKVGAVLGKVHQGSHNLAEAQKSFGNKKFFHQLRIEPFFEFLKQRYPDLRKDIDGHIRSCLEREYALVMGDYSPKNILVNGERIMPIDFEVIHYGDPSFDLGFLTTHLLLKSVKNPLAATSYFSVLRQVINGYFSCVHFAERSSLEAQAIQQLAWILLARVDGKSPAEYITGEREKEFIRSVSREILGSSMKTYEEVVNLFTLKIKSTNENRTNSWPAGL